MGVGVGAGVGVGGTSTVGEGVGDEVGVVGKGVEYSTNGVGDGEGASELAPVAVVFWIVTVSQVGPNGTPLASKQS